MDLGIFVITLLRSTVTVTPDAGGTEPVLYDAGFVKFLASQSSRKKPMVLANAGSTCGFTVVVSSVTGGLLLSPGDDFLHEIAIKTIIAVSDTNIFFISTNQLLLKFS